MHKVINRITAVAEEESTVASEWEMWSDPERILYDVSLFKCRDDYNEITFYISEKNSKDETRRRKLKTIINIIRIYDFSQCRNRKVIKRTFGREKQGTWKFTYGNPFWFSSTFLFPFFSHNSEASVVKLRQFKLMMMYDANWIWTLQQRPEVLLHTKEFNIFETIINEWN